MARPISIAHPHQKTQKSFDFSPIKTTHMTDFIWAPLGLFAYIQLRQPSPPPRLLQLVTQGFNEFYTLKGNQALTEQTLPEFLTQGTFNTKRDIEFQLGTIMSYLFAQMNKVLPDHIAPSDLAIKTESGERNSPLAKIELPEPDPEFRPTSESDLPEFQLRKFGAFLGINPKVQVGTQLAENPSSLPKLDLGENILILCRTETEGTHPHWDLYVETHLLDALPRSRPSLDPAGADIPEPLFVDQKQEAPAMRAHPTPPHSATSSWYQDEDDEEEDDSHTRATLKKASTAIYPVSAAEVSHALQSNSEDEQLLDGALLDTPEDQRRVSFLEHASVDIPEGYVEIHAASPTVIEIHGQDEAALAEDEMYDPLPEIQPRPYTTLLQDTFRLNRTFNKLVDDIQRCTHIPTHQSWQDDQMPFYSDQSVLIDGMLSAVSNLHLGRCRTFDEAEKVKHTIFDIIAKNVEYLIRSPEQYQQFAKSLMRNDQRFYTEEVMEKLSVPLYENWLTSVEKSETESDAECTPLHWA